MAAVLDKEVLNDCAICLQKVLYPARLPCSHTFCYLCAKGTWMISQKCALCRHEIKSNDFHSLRIDCGEIFATDVNDYAWFYKGREGWWQYDQRTCDILEDAHGNNVQNIEVLIAGHLYIIDFTKMIQIRKENNHKKRTIKRDFCWTKKKGIAGLQFSSNTDVDLIDRNGKVTYKNNKNDFISEKSNITDI